MHSMHTTTTSSGLAAPSHARSHVAPAAVPVAPRHAQQKQLSSPLPVQHHQLQHQPQQEQRRAVRVRVAQQEEVVVVDLTPALEPPAAANKSTGGVVFQSWEPQPGLKVSGPTVIITGGSQGVGRGLAFLSAKAGYNVVIASRNPSVLAATGKEVFATAQSGAGGKMPAVMAISLDITKEADLERLAETMAETFDQTTVLFNNAGACATGAVEDTPLEAVRDLMALNYFGHVYATTKLLPQLRAAAALAKLRRGSGGNLKGPAIVFVNSFAARIPLKNMSAYTAAKYALQGWTDVLRAELSGSGIFVGAVHPGVMRSSFLERAQWYGPRGEQGKQSMDTMMKAGSNPLVQDPDEVAKAAFDCAMGQQQNEVIVGPAFNAMITTYRLTGVNPFDLA